MSPEIDVYHVPMYVLFGGSLSTTDGLRTVSMSQNVISFMKMQIIV